MITLSRWLESDPRGDAPVALGREGARSGLEKLLGEEPRLGSLEVLKFYDVLLPGQEALVRVELQDQGRFQFSLHDAERRPECSFASGRGRLEPRR